MIDFVVSFIVEKDVFFDFEEVLVLSDVDEEEEVGVDDVDEYVEEEEDVDELVVKVDVVEELVVKVDVMESEENVVDELDQKGDEVVVESKKGEIGLLTVFISIPVSFCISFSNLKRTSGS